MPQVHYKKTEVTEKELIFEVEDFENVFLKATYNYCNAATYPHFAQFRDGKEIVTVFIEKYHEVSVTIRRVSKYFLADGVGIKNFLEKLKIHDRAEIITREEFFEYYNRLTKIDK